MASMQISTILNSYQLNANSQSLVQVAGDFFGFEKQWKTILRFRIVFKDE